MEGKSSCLWFSEGSVRVEDEEMESRRFGSDDHGDPNIDAKGAAYIAKKKEEWNNTKLHVVVQACISLYSIIA